MISLRFYQPEDFSEINYSLDDIQMMYTSTAEQALNRIKERTDQPAYPVTVVYGEKPAGFFVLDFGKDKSELSDNRNCVLLRSLSVNPYFQGKGIGKAVMLEVESFIRSKFKNCNEIVLAVNQDNVVACQIYLKTGYIDEGKTKTGRSGPQYIMSKKL